MQKSIGSGMLQGLKRARGLTGLEKHIIPDGQQLTESSAEQMHEKRNQIAFQATPVNTVFGQLNQSTTQAAFHHHNLSKFLLPSNQHIRTEQVEGQQNQFTSTTHGPSYAQFNAFNNARHGVEKDVHLANTFPVGNTHSAEGRSTELEAVLDSFSTSKSFAEEAKQHLREGSATHQELEIAKNTWGRNK